MASARLVALMLPLIAAGCGSSPDPGPAVNHPPAISRLVASPLTLTPGEASSLNAEGVDPDEDLLTYAWTASGGALSSSSGQATAWTAPTAIGTYELTCTVTDPAGEAASLTLPLTVVPPTVDRDGDGVTTALGDCNDFDPSTFPGAPESPDGQDNDCDGTADEGFGLYDEDEDGFTEVEGDCDDDDPAVHPGVGDPADGIDNDCDGTVDEGSSQADDDRDGYSEAEGDCDDARPDRSPDGLELADGVDNDCDGLIDEGTALVDDDGDGLSELEGDCDDGDPAVLPGALEGPDPDGDGTPAGDGKDNDCDGLVDEGTPDQDLDGDGSTIGQGDCDDLEPAVRPGTAERPDALDNDCDGTVDEGTTAADDDRDGYLETDGDCDDSRANIYPGATEYADGKDNDCDGLIDEGTTAVDDDGDGLRETDGDCDDTDPRARPDYPEVPDGQDNDCDTFVDEGTVLSDNDGDGYTPLEGDCNDFDASTWPGAVDVPGDGIANDCTGVKVNQPPVARWRIAGAAHGCTSITLDADGSFDPEGRPLSYRWYRIDGPGPVTLGSPTSRSTTFSWQEEGAYRIGLAVSDGTLTGAEQILELETERIRAEVCSLDGDGDGVSVSDGDCNDADPRVYPGATEVCDGIDQDCDGKEILFDETFDSLDPDHWLLSGDALAGSGEVLLTDAVRNAEGSLFFRAPLELAHFTVRFEVLMEGGTSGNGIAFAVIDEDSSSFLGGGAGGNGLLGLDGWGVELDTNQDSSYGDPGSDHISLVHASDLATAYTYKVKQLRSVTLNMEVRYDAGTVTVFYNSAQIFSIPMAWERPSRGYIGFTAATGQETDRHHVMRVSYECR